MRTLDAIAEFKQEAANAVYTKQQAVAVTLQLLERERANPANSERERETLTRAIERAEFRYIDATKSATDRMLDTIGVARFTTEEIAAGIDALLFDVE